MRTHLMSAVALIALVTAIAAGAEGPAAEGLQNRGWTLGPDAETKQNPFTPDQKTLTVGRAVYKQKCQRCHGPGGLGDGPDADPDATRMDLTDPKRAGQNPDGVVFYKVSNGRNSPKMPAFKEELTEEQIWMVVTYVQSLRRKS